MLHLEVEVVLVGLRAELDLLEHDRRLVLARGLLLLRRLVLELAEVHDLADRRRGARIDLDQLEPCSSARRERLVRGDDADLGAVGADDAHLGHADAAADAVVVRRAGGGLIEWPWDVLSPVRWLFRLGSAYCNADAAPTESAPGTQRIFASAASRRANSSSGVAGCCWPSRVRGETTRAAMSFSPTTTM